MYIAGIHVSNESLALATEILTTSVLFLYAAAAINRGRKAFKNAANKNVRVWAPIGLGLAAVPALPFMFDKPVEEAVEWTFHKGFELAGGKHTTSHDAINKKEL